MNKIAEFNVHFSQILTPSGELSCAAAQLLESGVDSEKLVDFYEWMQLARTFDTKAIALQRTGRLGTYPSCAGHEGLGAAIGKAMKKEDVFCQSYRETTTLITRGVKLEEVLLYWGGDERGSDFEVPREDMPFSVPIASQCCHAVGISYAFKLRKQDRVTVAVFGDGATSKGDFYEALNAAGVWKLPMVMVVSNNQWAISVPREKQTATETLAQKAIAGGVPCRQIDGNDIIGSYLAINEAIEHARTGQGPFLIEALTYRLSDHTTADDAKRYRDDDTVTTAWKNEPISRLKKYLLNTQIVDQSRLDSIDKSCNEKVETAVDIYLNTETQPPESMFQYLYKELPNQLKDQLRKVKDGGLS